MRLKSIKLAGFKSFVDPTTVPFPSNLTAVVGPNGCGKSNIIDAVRWVMGESSAKNLRGESMTDVIFNGATTRKPVGQASIELVFDNTEGKLVGEYAKFSEISIKRRVSREGTSDYFLNGTKCRRRDITDIFLGTGLGPRSYAIIEQGMISKLIESKPEELRIFIEEAAGISKYKERRKETESRLRRTRENLDRLTDIREELERQLRHLHKQAQAAEKYTTLKAEERLFKAQIAALKWQELNCLVEQKQGQISEAELELEEAVTNRVSHETRIEQLRIAHSEKNDEYNKAQAAFYATGSEIAKLEQSIRHNKDRLSQLEKDRNESKWQIEELKKEQEEESARLADLEMELEDLSPLLEEQLLLAEETAEALETAEESMHLWQQKWDDFNLNSSNARTQAEIEQSKIQQFENNIRKTTEQVSRLTDEISLLEGQVSTVELDACKEELLLVEEKEEALLLQKEEIFEVLSTDKKRVLVLDGQLNDLRTESQTLRGKVASLSALQESVVSANENNSECLASLNQHEELVKLIETLNVKEGWDLAVESALSHFISGYCITSANEALFETIAKSKGQVTLIETGEKSLARTHTGKEGSLSSVIVGDNPLGVMTDHILLAEDIHFAVNNRGSLGKAEYFVCKDGMLVGSNWLVKPDDGDVSKGVLQRQRELEQSNERLAELLQKIDVAEDEAERLRIEIKQREERREDIILQVSQVEREKLAIKQQLGVLEVRQSQLASRIVELQQSQAQAQNHLEADQEALQISRHAWQDALGAVESFADEKEALLAERDKAREALDNLRQKSRHEKDVSHRQQLQLQSLESEKRSLEKDKEKNENQVSRLKERLDDIELQYAALDEPIENMQFDLEQLLDKRLSDEEKLAVSRQALEQVDIDLRSDEHNRQTVEQRVQILRNALQEIRMESQALEIKRNGIRDQLRQDNYDLDAVLDALPEDAVLDQWQVELEKIGIKVQRLGAINLAAIDEYKTQSERKTYLDEQNDDLVEAITTLENAIRKIDKETRAKFKETYDKVNAGLQNLFPKVFGGGSAYLELTGDDLLETGVAIMARPPGKKNSTIHLLSGGEKALTAIALVFSIFQLNPAPFCMLDEVDAPLDDANVARYANMVREMSSQVQFIYISHNKIAMEMADQLMGVTMHEPGVSRLVSVNVDEAAALAAI